MKYYVRNEEELKTALQVIDRVTYEMPIEQLIRAARIAAAAIDEQARVMRATEKVLRSTLDTAQRIE